MAPRPSARGCRRRSISAGPGTPWSSGDSRGIGFRSLSEQIDTTTSGGTLVFHPFGALAEFERELIRERTRAGLAAARARGRQGGRPKKLDTTRKLAMAPALYDDGTHSIQTICPMLGIARATLYRAITPRVVKPEPLPSTNGQRAHTISRIDHTLDLPAVGPPSPALPNQG